MSEDPPTDVHARLEEIETRLDEQAAQLRFFWGMLLYGMVTVIAFVLVPMVGLILGIMGLVFGGAIAFARIA